MYTLTQATNATRKAASEPGRHAFCLERPVPFRPPEHTWLETCEAFPNKP